VSDAPNQFSLRGMRTPGDAPYRSAPSTGRQRLYVRCLMIDVGLPTFEITLMHRRHFLAANLEFAMEGPDKLPGRRVDDVLTELTADQASALAKVLQKERDK